MFSFCCFDRCCEIILHRAPFPGSILCLIPRTTVMSQEWYTLQDTPFMHQSLDSFLNAWENTPCYWHNSKHLPLQYVLTSRSFSWRVKVWFCCYACITVTNDDHCCGDAFNHSLCIFSQSFHMYNTRWRLWSLSTPGTSHLSDELVADLRQLRVVSGLRQKNKKRHDITKLQKADSEAMWILLWGRRKKLHSNLDKGLIISDVVESKSESSLSESLRPESSLSESLW